jgi:capsule polysaccharide export protein KpsE/RkpR
MKIMKSLKKSILVLGTTFLLTVLMLSACMSSEDKVKNAEDNVQDAKENLANAQTELYYVRLYTITTYEQFKIEAEKVIAVQQNNIDDLRDKMANSKKEMNDGYDKKLDELETKNNELKQKLEDYKQNGQDNWTGFKNEFNHDMNELGKAFKDLTVENVK